MGFLPQVNAKLLAVSRQGFTEDYDRASGTPNVVWSGNWDAYVQQKVVSNFNSSDQLDRVLAVTLFVSADIPVQLEPGDILTFQAGNPNTPQTLVGKIQNFNDPAFMPALLDYYRIALEEVNVP